MRRYDIDWLRVITIGLLLIYHIAIVFQPWGMMIGFIQSDESLSGLWVPMGMLNVWRIPLLFFVSGMGVSFAMRKRDWKALIKERSQRILLPLLVGVFTVVPLHMYIWSDYYGMPSFYRPEMGHLWFLGNIFSYVVILSPIFFYLKKREGSSIHRFIQKLFRTPFSLLLILGFMLVEVLIVNPGLFELYVKTWHGYFLGFVAFFIGFLCVYAGEGFWIMLLKWKWVLLIMAVVLYAIRYFYFNQKSPNYLLSLESNLWIFTILGFGYKYLRRPGSVLAYLSEAAYPIYIWHIVFLYLGASWVLPMDLPVVVKFLLVNVVTYAGCFGMYEVIRRVKILRLCFGLKVQIGQKASAQEGKISLI